jgi:tetratricopeptide (TPR) repeat protein
VLLVGTAREVEARRQQPLASALSDLRRDELVLTIPMQPLASEETTALIGATLGGADGAVGDAAAISPPLARLIYHRGEGNAFFTRQLTHALHERGDLQFTEEEWRLRENSVSTDEAPESIRAVIGQRLMRLMPVTQDVLREGSVLGQVFVFGDLQRMNHRGEEVVEEALEEADRAGIVRAGERDEYHFNHALTRDTLYTELSPRRRRRLHRTAADGIEQTPERERRAAELAYHLLAADEGERALPYALLAGDQAETIYAHAEAESHYRSALALAQVQGNHSSETQALERLGSVLGVLGRYDEAIEVLDRALQGYQALGDEDGELRTVAALLEIQGLFGRGMLEETIARVQAILTRLEPRDNTPLMPARAADLAAVYGGLALLYLGAGRHDEQLITAKRAVELARTAGDEQRLVVAQHRLYVAHPDVDLDLPVWEEQLTLAQRTGQTKFVVFAHNRLGSHHSMHGTFALGMTHMEDALAAAEQRGDPMFLAWQLSNFTEFLLHTSDWQRARDTAARAEALIGEVDPQRVTWHGAGISIWPGIFAVLDGREEEGRRLLEQAMDRIERTGAAHLLVLALRPLAEADLLAGHPELAYERLTTYLEAHFATPNDGAVGVHVLLAWAEGELRQFAQAEMRLVRVLERAPALLQTNALLLQGLLAIRQGRFEVAEAALKEALTRTRAMPYPYGGAKAYGRLEAARGDLVEAREDFMQALVICNQLGEGLYRNQIQHDMEDLETNSPFCVPEQ